jgi:hypothetical protein
MRARSDVLAARLGIRHRQVRISGVMGQPVTSTIALSPSGLRAGRRTNTVRTAPGSSAAATRGLPTFAVTSAPRGGPRPPKESTRVEAFPLERAGRRFCRNRSGGSADDPARIARPLRPDGERRRACARAARPWGSSSLAMRSFHRPLPRPSAHLRLAEWPPATLAARRRGARAQPRARKSSAVATVMPIVNTRRPVDRHIEKHRGWSGLRAGAPGRDCPTTRSASPTPHRCEGEAFGQQWLEATREPRRGVSVAST